MLSYLDFENKYLGYDTNHLNPVKGSLAYYMKEISDDKYLGRHWRTNHGMKSANYILEECKNIITANYLSGTSEVTVLDSPGLFELEKDNITNAFLEEQDITFPNCCPGKEITTPNILAFLPSTSNSSKFIVVSAHYDHLGEKNGQIFNGADDNASGVSAIMTLLKVFSLEKHRKYGLLFSFFTGEEDDFQGSKQLAKTLYGLEKIDGKVLNVSEKLAGIINMDMISRAVNDTGCSEKHGCPQLTLDGNKQGLNIIKSVERSNGNYNLDKKYAMFLRGIHSEYNTTLGWVDRSDQWSFLEIDKNLPAILLSVQQKPLSDGGTGDGDCYHQPCDIYETSNPRIACKIAYLSYQLIKNW